mgnify:CR=1
MNTEDAGQGFLDIALPEMHPNLRRAVGPVEGQTHPPPSEPSTIRGAELSNCERHIEPLVGKLANYSFPNKYFIEHPLRQQDVIDQDQFK